MAERENSPDPAPAWDDEIARRLLGKTVLIGLTLIDGGRTEQQQMFGKIVNVESGVGISVALAGVRNGELYCLPPHVQNFYPAAKGEYRVRATGEVVVDPNFTTTWTIERPA